MLVQIKQNHLVGSELGASSICSQQGRFWQPGHIPLPQPGERAAGEAPGAAPAPGIKHRPGDRDRLRMCRDVVPWVDNRQAAARELLTGDLESSFHHEGGWMLAVVPRKAVKSSCLAVFKAQVKQGLWQPHLSSKLSMVWVGVLGQITSKRSFLTKLFNDSKSHCYEHGGNQRPKVATCWF